jgi:hypothetical protein
MSIIMITSGRLARHGVGRDARHAIAYCRFTASQQLAVKLPSDLSWIVCRHDI